MKAPISMEKLNVFENVVFWSIFIQAMFYVFDVGELLTELVRESGRELVRELERE